MSAGGIITHLFFRKDVFRMRKGFALMATVLAVAMILSLSVPAFAAEVADGAPAVVEDVGGVIPLSYTKTTTVRTNSSWTTVANESNGFGCNVTVAIPFLAALDYKVSVGYRTSGAQATPTIIADDLFGLSGNSKTFLVPANAKFVDVKIISRNSMGGISSFNVNVTVNK